MSLFRMGLVILKFADFVGVLLLRLVRRTGVGGRSDCCCDPRRRKNTANGFPRPTTDLDSEAAGVNTPDAFGVETGAVPRTPNESLLLNRFAVAPEAEPRRPRPASTDASRLIDARRSAWRFARFCIVIIALSCAFSSNSLWRSASVPADCGACSLTRFSCSHCPGTCSWLLRLIAVSSASWIRDRRSAAVPARGVGREGLCELLGETVPWRVRCACGESSPGGLWLREAMRPSMDCRRPRCDASKEPRRCGPSKDALRPGTLMLLLRSREDRLGVDPGSFTIEGTMRRCCCLRVMCPIGCAAATPCMTFTTAAFPVLSNETTMGSWGDVETTKSLGVSTLPRNFSCTSSAGPG
eukprot:PhM_4_TR3103/c0_g1_i1/m.61465